MIELYKILDLALKVYSWGLIVYIFMSWFPGARESSIGLFLTRICEPYLEQFRRFIPPLGMIDLSPIVGIFVIYLARTGLLELFKMLLY